MKSGVVALITLLTSMGLAVPVTAQIQSPSQDFFEQGREQLEREIQVLQGNPPNSEQSLQKPHSEPVLEVSPSPASDRNQKPNEVEIPSQKPDAVETPTPKPSGVYNRGS
jgi:hypothetical protein